MSSALDETVVEREIQHAMKAAQTPGLALAIVRGQEMLAAYEGLYCLTDGQTVAVTISGSSLWITLH